MPLELVVPESLDEVQREAFESGANLGYDHVNYALAYGTGDEDDPPRDRMQARFQIEGRLREAFRDGWALGAMQARQDHEDGDTEQPDPPVSYRDKFNVMTERRWDSRTVESTSINNKDPKVRTTFDLGTAEVINIRAMIEAALQSGERQSMVGSWFSRMLSTPNARFSFTIETDRYQ